MSLAQRADPRIRPSFAEMLTSIPIGALIAAVAASGLFAALQAALGSRGPLGRTNFTGDPIQTAGGLALVCGLLVAGAMDAALLREIAVLFPFVIGGLLDDLFGTPAHKGFRGHLGALRRGRITTGLLKIGFGGAGALWAAARVGSPHEIRFWSDTAVVALMANLFNLLDLRPLRALKAYWFAALLLSQRSVGTLGVLLVGAIPYAGFEARRRVMLGDTGAMLLGAALGVCAISAYPVLARCLLAALLVVLHVWAERNSISGFIARRPVLKAIDAFGWSQVSGPPSTE